MTEEQNIQVKRAREMRELPKEVRDDLILKADNVIDGRKIYSHWNSQ